VTLKSAWFLSHRIRLAMDQNAGKLGEDGGIVEADETYFGRKPRGKKGRGGFRHQNAVLALVERGGKMKSVRVKNFNDIKKVIKDNIDPAARFMTDEHKRFRKIGKQFASHETVNHFQKEYARGDVTTIPLKASCDSPSVAIMSPYCLSLRSFSSEYDSLPYECC
jgi:ISXO2-like transposase domain